MLITVFGRRGSGKTTLIKHLIPVQKKPVIVPDILGNFTDEGWTVANSHIEGLREAQAYVRDPSNHPGIIVVTGSDANTIVDYMCSALWKIPGGTIVLDEVDAIGEADCPCFDDTIRYGRNKGIDVITGCRRPAELSKNVTAGADIAFVFNTHEPRDIMYYEEFLGEELAHKLPSLPQHHGVYKDFRSRQFGTYKTTQDGEIVILTRESEIKTASDKPIKKQKQEKNKSTASPPTPEKVADEELSDVDNS